MKKPYIIALLVLIVALISYIITLHISQLNMDKYGLFSGFQKQTEKGTISGYQTIGKVDVLVNSLYGWSVKKIRTGNEKVKSILRENVGIPIKHKVNLGRLPMLESAYELLENAEGGTVEIELRSDDNLYIDGKKVVLHQNSQEKTDGLITLFDLFQKYDNKYLTFLNSAVLEYLMDHPELVPEHWKKGDMIFFFGSLYTSKLNGAPHAICMEWVESPDYESEGILTYSAPLFGPLLGEYTTATY